MRQRWKTEIEERLPQLGRPGAYGTVVIRDIARLDEYPRIVDLQPGPSSWFRAELLGLYHRGIEVGLRFASLVWEEAAGVWRVAHGSTSNMVKVRLVGRIPYERLENIDWTGDEYEGRPHIYCRFDSEHREPYETLTYCEKNEEPSGFYYRQFVDVTEVVPAEEWRASDA